MNDDVYISECLLCGKSFYGPRYGDQLCPSCDSDLEDKVYNRTLTSNKDNNDLLSSIASNKSHVAEVPQTIKKPKVFKQNITQEEISIKDYLEEKKKSDQTNKNKNKEQYEIECKLCNSVFKSASKYKEYCNSCTNKIRVCFHCGEEYIYDEVLVATLKKSGKTFTQFKDPEYCSKKCKYIPRECCVCNKSFQADRYDKSDMYCSKACKEKKFCKQCNEPIESDDGYCSDSCKYAQKRCVICDETFQGIRHDEDDQYCSDNCRSLKKCPICHMAFRPKNRRHIACTDDCDKKLTELNKIKKLDSKELKSLSNKDLSYLVGYKVRAIVQPAIDAIKSSEKFLDYNLISGFNESIKIKIRERDNNQCQICSRDYTLEVHHIIPRSHGGDHSEGNLVTLCTKCHRAVETRNIDHAVKKCTEYALVYLSKKELTPSSNKREVIINAVQNLSEVYKSIVDDEEKEDILLRLDSIISLLDDSLT